MIELYAITDHPSAPLPDVAALSLAPMDGLAAVCAPAGAGEVTPDALWRHEEVVEELMRTRDLLPVRYGTRLEDERAAARALAERRRELSTALDRVRGAVELSLRVAIPERQSPADREAVIRTVHEPLAILARESRRRSMRAAYLVDRMAIEPFTALVSRLQDANPQLGLLLTGPWPPYSFAGP